MPLPRRCRAVDLSVVTPFTSPLSCRGHRVSRKAVDIFFGTPMNRKTPSSKMPPKAIKTAWQQKRGMLKNGVFGGENERERIKKDENESVARKNEPPSNGQFDGGLSWWCSQKSIFLTRIIQGAKKEINMLMPTQNTQILLCRLFCPGGSQ